MLFDRLLAASASCSDEAFLRHAGRSYTVATLLKQATALAKSWGCLASRRVALTGLASAEFVAALAALDSLGCQVFLSPPLDECAAHAFAETHSVQTVIAATPGRLQDTFTSEKERPNPFGTSVVTILTSGTTGQPKAVNHTWDSLSRPVRTGPQFEATRWLLTFPITLYAGLQVFLQALFSRSVLVLPEESSPGALLSFIREEGVECISATPTFWRNLLLFAPREQVAACSLRQITLGGEVATQEILDSLASVFPTARIVHVYATSELGRCFSVADGQAGFPVCFLGERLPEGIQIRIRAGRLEARSVNRMVGYDQEAPSAESGWLTTDDLVELRGDRVFFLGRVSDVINVGGAKVSPFDVECFLRSVPGVAAARVYGKLNPITHEIVAADIVAAEGFEETIVRERIRKAALDKLRPHERPRLLRFVLQLQVNASGKTSRRDS